ncbi:MAG: DUF2304 family protein [Candidatus Woesearchaeota archaeon]
MINLLQIVVLLFSIFAISRAFLRYKDKKISFSNLALWCIVWAGAIVVVMLPQTSFFFANILGIQRGADFVVYISIIIIFYLLFKLYVKINSVEKEITEIIREIAIKKQKKR